MTPNQYERYYSKCGQGKCSTQNRRNDGEQHDSSKENYDGSQSRSR